VAVSRAYTIESYGHVVLLFVLFQKGFIWRLLLNAVLPLLASLSTAV